MNDELLTNVGISLKEYPHDAVVHLLKRCYQEVMLRRQKAFREGATGSSLSRLVVREQIEKGETPLGMLKWEDYCVYQIQVDIFKKRDQTFGIIRDYPKLKTSIPGDLLPLFRDLI